MVSFIQSVTGRPRRYINSFAPRYCLNFPKRKNLNISGRLLSMVTNAHFEVGEITLPEPGIIIKSLPMKRCIVHKVGESYRNDIDSFMYRKIFFDRYVQLLAHIVLSVHDGAMPDPEPDEDAVMLFLYTKIVHEGPATYGQTRAIRLTPVQGKWRIDDTSDVTFIHPGDVLCVMDR